MPQALQFIIVAFQVSFLTGIGAPATAAATDGRGWTAGRCRFSLVRLAAGGTFEGRSTSKAVGPRQKRRDGSACIFAHRDERHDVRQPPDIVDTETPAELPAWPRWRDIIKDVPLSAPVVAKF